MEKLFSLTKKDDIQAINDFIGITGKIIQIRPGVADGEWIVHALEGKSHDEMIREWKAECEWNERFRKLAEKQTEVDYEIFCSQKKRDRSSAKR